MYSKVPPKDSRFLCSKTLTGVLWEGAIRENPGYRDFKNFFTAEFSHFFDNLFYRCPNWVEPYVKIPGTGISKFFLLQSLVTF